MNAETAKAERQEVPGTIVAHAHSGVEPEVMGLGPVDATRKALAKAGSKYLT